jgi:uncharacterized protein (DUF169 family)
MSPTPKNLAVFNKFTFERKPVGVKFVAERPKDLKRPEKQLDFCEMLVEAQKGKAFYVQMEDFTCIGPLLLGMKEGDPIFESGRVGPKLGAYKDPRANRRLYQYLPRLVKGTVKYVQFAPLDKLTFEPDLLIIMANVTQAEILIRAKCYETGESWQAKGTTVAVCSWLYLYPLTTGEMNMIITGIGFGMRSRRLFPEGNFLLSIPWDKLPQIVKGLEEMEWVPESFTLGAQGHKNKVKRIVAELEKEDSK